MNRVAPPKQERARRTLRRLLAAAEAMLDEGTFEAATVAEIARRADSSIGSFYARFPSKDALLYELIDEVHEEMLAAAEALERSTRPGDDLEARVRAYVGMVVPWTRRRRGVLRARLVHHLRGEAVPATQVARTRQQVAAVRRYFAPCLDEVRAPDPARALDFALDLVDAMVAARFLLRGPGLEGFTASDDEHLADDLVQIVLATLGRAP